MDFRRSTALHHLEYSAWATQRILDSVGSLTEEELLRDMQTSHSSIFGTLEHTYRADALWLARLSGTGKAVLSDIAAAEEIASLRKEWADVHARTIAFAGALPENEWSRVAEYTFMSGEPASSPVYESLLHVVNHATYHRGQVVTMLRQLGASPIGTDFITYVRLNLM